ncbi:hypothetical protein ABE458_01045 [Pseudomonas protegens]|uniref:hypothetical protein n=1 Tax=Pseudomonas protegens TaxID=380021 RepID=UPI00320B0DAE
MSLNKESVVDKTILHKLVSVYSALIDELMLRSNGFSYHAHFLTPDLDSMGGGMSREQFDEYYRIYLLGVLERCHLTCLTSLARTNSWLKSSLFQLNEGSLLGFSASLRGLLEATADTHDVTPVLVNQLYNYFPFIYLRVTRPNNTTPVVVLKLLEERLIHYSYARRQAKGVKSLPEHTNKNNTEYIQAIESIGAVGAKDLYQLLCELTHPAAPSVSCFLKETEQEIILDFYQDEQIINEIVSDYQEAVKVLVVNTVNSALVTLIILCKMGFRGPAPDQEYFSNIAGAAKIFSDIDEFLLRAKSEDFVFLEDMWHFKATA